MCGNGIRNLTVDLDGFFQQCSSGGLYKQRNRAVDHRNQSWNYNVFAAQGNGCMKIYILLEVRFLLEPPIAAMAATRADKKDIKKSPHFAMKLKTY